MQPAGRMSPTGCILNPISVNSPTFSFFIPFSQFKIWIVFKIVMKSFKIVSTLFKNNKFSFLL